MCDQFFIFWITASKGTSWSQPCYGAFKFESTWDFLPHCEERLYQIEPQALLERYILSFYHVFDWPFHCHLVANGWPRTSGLFLLLLASDIDPISGKENWICQSLSLCLHVFPIALPLSLMQDLITPLLPAIQMMWALPAVVTYEKDQETVSFTNIQLSTQGAERQRKDVRGSAGERWKLLDKLLERFYLGTWCTWLFQTGAESQPSLRKVDAAKKGYWRW